MLGGPAKAVWRESEGQCRFTRGTCQASAGRMLATGKSVSAACSQSRVSGRNTWTPGVRVVDARFENWACRPHTPAGCGSTSAVPSSGAWREIFDSDPADRSALCGANATCVTFRGHMSQRSAVQHHRRPRLVRLEKQARRAAGVPPGDVFADRTIAAVAVSDKRRRWRASPPSSPPPPPPGCCDRHQRREPGSRWGSPLRLGTQAAVRPTASPASPASPHWP